MPAAKVVKKIVATSLAKDTRKSNSIHLLPLLDKEKKSAYHPHHCSCEKIITYIPAKKEGFYMKKKKQAKTIGEMTNSRRMWGFNASTRVVKNKKGEGSYSRKGKKSWQHGA